MPSGSIGPEDVRPQLHALPGQYRLEGGERLLVALHDAQRMGAVLAFEHQHHAGVLPGDAAAAMDPSEDAPTLGVFMGSRRAEPARLRTRAGNT